jgi:hypothetical protein
VQFKVQELNKIKFENSEIFRMEKTNNFFLQHPFNMRFVERGSDKEPLFRVLKLPVCFYESFAKMMMSCLDH